MNAMSPRSWSRRPESTVDDRGRREQMLRAGVLLAEHKDDPAWLRRFARRVDFAQPTTAADVQRLAAWDRWLKTIEGELARALAGEVTDVRDFERRIRPFRLPPVI